MSDKKNKIDLPVSAINELSEILKKQELTEIEVETGDYVIKVRKEQQVVSNVQVPAAAPQASIASSLAAAAPSPAKASSNGADLHEVKSPMVGTYYQSSAPGSDPFVKVGDKIKKGDTLCIVEAMKLMNELPSDIEGEIVEICVNDADAISYGQTLMKVRKS